MKAVVFRQYESPESLALIEVEKPAPGEHEVLVRVHATSVNSWDWDILNGIPFVNRFGFGLFRPKEKIIGCDMAGIVEKAGSKVKDWKGRDEVLGDLSGCGMGAFAEYVCVPEKVLARRRSL